MSDSMDCCPLVFSIHGISQAEYWSGLPFPSSEDLLDPGIEPMSPELAGGFFTDAPPEKPLNEHGCVSVTLYSLTLKFEVHI